MKKNFLFCLVILLLSFSGKAFAETRQAADVKQLCDLAGEGREAYWPTADDKIVLIIASVDADGALVADADIYLYNIYKPGGTTGELSEAEKNAFIGKQITLICGFDDGTNKSHSILEGGKYKLKYFAVESVPETQKFGIEGCERHYQSAVKFIVDTPVVHPFSVSATSKVIFSRGNLQYCPAKDEWRFALRQFDRVGNGKAANPPAGADYATPNYGITTVFYDSIDYSTKDATTPSGFKTIRGVPCNNLLVSKNYQGWIDLFAWGTSGHGKRSGDQYAVYFHPYDLNNQDVNTTYNRYGYGPSYGGGHATGAIGNNFDTTSGLNRYFDWGYANHIREFSKCTHNENGSLVHAKDSTMYAPGVWRTLTSAEWTYLLTTRKVGGEDSVFSFVRIKYGSNATDTVSGTIIYPDDFSFSEAGVASMAFGARAVTQINAADWAALEEAGCVFLPTTRYLDNAAGGPQMTDEGLAGCRSYYYSSTAINAQHASNVFMGIYFTGNRLQPNYSSTSRKTGIFVRLAQDVQ